MFFWGSHANGKFDEATICYAIDRNISVLGKELQALVDTGIIEKEVDKGVNCYYLTLNQGKRQSIIEWASPGHSRR